MCVGRMEPAEEVKKEIMRRYNRNPQGWQVLLARDAKGYYSTIVWHGSEFWLIKEERVNPFKFVGYGVREKAEGSEAIKTISPHPFGFRPLSEEQIGELIRGMQGEQNWAGTIDKVLSIEPVPMHKIASPLVLHGPVVHAARQADFLSDKQKELDLKLRAELDNLINRKYRHLRAPYV